MSSRRFFGSVASIMASSRSTVLWSVPCAIRSFTSIGHHLFLGLLARFTRLGDLLGDRLKLTHQNLVYRAPGVLLDDLGDDPVRPAVEGDEILQIVLLVEVDELVFGLWFRFQFGRGRLVVRMQNHFGPNLGSKLVQRFVALRFAGDVARAIERSGSSLLDFLLVLFDQVEVALRFIL